MAVRLVKQFTRDFSLFISEWWRETLGGNFRSRVGAGYSDYVAVGDGLSITYYYPETDGVAIKAAYLGKLRADPEYYSRESSRFRKEIDQTKAILARVAFKAGLDEEAVSLLKPRFLMLYPMLRLNLLSPSAWAADIREALGESAEKTISLAYGDRVYGEGVFEAIDALLRRLAAEKLGREGKPGRWAKFLTAEDLELLASGALADWPAVEKRAKGFVYCKGKLFYTSDHLAVFRENGYAYYEESLQVNGTVKGSIAFQGGKVRGRVRLLFATEQLPSFKNGEVLVSPMTVPDFVPAMRKAAAIVTDEGGITCHAAIVARELGKPCVIGTKVATKTFNDGDLVEVDSEKGVVRRVQ